MRQKQVAGTHLQASAAVYRLLLFNPEVPMTENSLKRFAKSKFGRAAIAAYRYTPAK